MFLLPLLSTRCQQQVAVLDLSELLIRVRSALPRDGRLLMKLDIEGMETSVLPHLISTRGERTTMHACICM